MVSRGVFLPKQVRAQLANLSSHELVALELHLENLEHFLHTDGVNEFRNRFVPSADGERFVTDVGGHRVVFTVDGHSRVLYVHEIAPKPVDG